MRFFFRITLTILICSLLLIEISFSKTTKKIPKFKYKHVGISEQNLLNINYFNRNKILLQKQSSSGPDSIKILALRVSFQQDTLETTTGNGTFILSKNDTTIIDPPPHDREYFLAQIQAVAHYFRTVSNKKLVISGEVHPQGNETSYVLPKKMNYYSPKSTDEENDLRLAELFKDAILTASTQDKLPFLDFDIFIVFHAGVGQDFADDFDTTPNDIPSAFLNKKHLQKYLGNNDPNYQGIEIPGGFVREGIILPETQNQNGSEFALKGTFVLYLGNQLGLPSLFDTENGRAGIGAWGLMDVGSSNYFGLIPAEPCAWSKVFMGWEEPVLLEPNAKIKVAVSKSVSASHIDKIPINSREYFLIENRNRDFNKDHVTTGADQFGHRLEFNPFGNFTAQIDTSLGERLGVITKVFDYDFGIPGDGILVWHIDDRIIEENYLSNTINSNPEHRGVDLEEADGSQDIGQNYGFLSPGSGSEFGVADDAFFLENEIHQIANKADFVSFSPTSSPSSNSYSNGISGVTLRNFSQIDSVMSFDFLNSFRYENFPQRFAGEIAVKYPPVVAPLDNNSEQAIFFTPGNNNIFAWKADGFSLIPNNERLFYHDWRGNSNEFQAAVFDTVAGYFTFYPLIADVNEDGNNEIICSADHNKIFVWTPYLDSNTGYATRIFQANIPVEQILIGDHKIIIAANNNLSSNSLRPENVWRNDWNLSTNSNILNLCLTRGENSESFLVIVLKNGEILKIDKTGQIRNTQTIVLPGNNNVSIISGYLENNSAPSVMISTDNQVCALTQDLEILNGFPVKFNESILMKPIITDVDQDGFGEIVCVTPNKLFALNFNGTLSSGFPVEIPTKYSKSDFFSSSPISLAGQNETYLLVKDASNNILAIDGDGKLVKDFILSGGGFAPSPFLILSDLNKDDFLKIIDPNSDGLLNIRRTEFQSLRNSSWLQTNFDEKGTNFNPTKIEVQTNNRTEFLPYAFNYPNPTEGNQTTFRFYIMKDANVKIDIFNLAGEKVKTIEAPATGNVENEIIWTIEDVASGVYMARLEASDGQEKAHKMIKVAVVK